MTKRHAAAVLFVAFVTLAGGIWAPVQAAGTSSELVAAVQNVNSEADKFRSLMANINAGQIHLVNVQSAMSSQDEAVYRASVRKNASGIADLRDTLNHTTVTGTDGVLITLRRLLLKENVSIDQITGVHVGADGQITLFYE